MSDTKPPHGVAELRAARRKSRGLYWAVGLFSVFANLLMLTGPIYMLNVYDRVLGSRSIETLIALTALVGFLYAMMALLDYARARVMGRAGARFQSQLDDRVFDAVMRRAARPDGAPASSGLADLEAIQRFMTSPLPGAFFDLPWTPIFLVGITIFHPWLGILAIAGGLVLVVVALINQVTTRRLTLEASQTVQNADARARAARDDAEMVRAMGMGRAAFDRWQIIRKQSLDATLGAADLSGTYTAMTKALRLFLQSAMLGLGAYLVIRGELTPGAMIAASILLGRALAPIEMSISQWPLVQRARQGWNDLSELLAAVPPEDARTALPRPVGRIDVQKATVVPPGERHAVLKALSFSLPAGKAMGVIGTSGAGKSSLARALTGVWPVISGSIRLDGATLDRYDPHELGNLIGYLPQRVQLFDGTVAENIARMSLSPDDAAVVSAAKKASAHEMILALPDAYETRVTPNGGRLSGGQIQRIGLARAMYGDPVLLVLDEPNSNLDDKGSQALNAAIRALKAEGRSAIIIAHRPAAIRECDLLLMIEDGIGRAFGPRDDVLRDVTKNHADLIPGQAPRAVEVS